MRKGVYFWRGTESKEGLDALSFRCLFSPGSNPGDVVGALKRLVVTGWDRK